MLQIKQWLTPPTFQDDEDKTIRARLLHITLLSVLIFLAIVMVGGWLIGTTPTAVFGIDAAGIGTCLLFYYWTRQGRVGLASAGLITLGIILITLAVASLGTIRAPTSATYLTLVIVAGLLFDLRGFIGMAILSSLAILGLIIAENAGLLPPPDLSVTLTQWITYTALFGASGGLTIMVVRSTRQALRQADWEIAERRRVEQALRASEERYRTFFENSEDAILLTAPDGKIFAANPAACRMFGRTEVEICQVGREAIFAPGLPLELEERQRIGKFRGELTYLWRDGEPFPGEVTSAVFRGEDGQLRTSMIIRDITERKHAEAEIRQRNAELTTLNRIGQTLNKLATPAEICETIFSLVGQVLDNRNLFIAQYDATRQQITFPVYTLNGQRHIAEGRRFGNGLTKYIIRTNAPLLVKRDLSGVMAERGIALLGTPVRSLLAAPMRASEKILGIIALQDFERDDAFDEHDLELLMTIASQAAVALENARLFEEQRESLAMTTRLYELSARVLTATTVEETAHLVAETIRAGFAADACTIHLFDETGAAAFRLSVGFSPNFHQEAQGRPRGLTARARESREPIIATADELNPRVRAEGIQANIALPLPGEKENIGVLFISYRQSHQFSERERNLMSLFANQTALAFRRARLFQQAR